MIHFQNFFLKNESLPICFPRIKTLGTVDCPVLAFSSLWISGPEAPKVSSSTAVKSIRACLKACLSLLQKGQVVLEKTITSFSAIHLATAVGTSSPGLITGAILLAGPDRTWLLNWLEEKRFPKSCLFSPVSSNGCPLFWKRPS